MTEDQDPIRSFLLDSLADGRSKGPQELARTYYAARAKSGDPPDAWRRYLVAIRQQALSLARAGQLEFLRKGKVVDPDDVKGVVRFRKALTGRPDD